jgi:Spy/CpxP family protein refolding chaperone
MNFTICLYDPQHPSVWKAQDRRAISAAGGIKQMNKLAQRFFVLIALVSCVALAAAQGGGQRGGQRRGGGNTELTLAARADVQKELAVTDDQKTKIADLNTKANEARRAAFQNAQQMDPAERAKIMADMRAQQKKDLAGVLNDGQMKRLGELLLQREGYNALGQESVQKDLGLSSDQVSKIKDLMQKAQEANAALRQNQDMTREERTAAQQKVLTSDQDAKFKSMQGKPFTFDTGNGGG